MGWRDRAACRGYDTDQWFPDREYRPNHADQARIADAKRVCASCPVVADCLEWALEHDCIHGVWGGATSIDRARIVQERTGRRPSGRRVDPQQVAEVMRLTDQGLSAKRIGQQLGMAQRVVVRYRARGREREEVTA